MRNNKLFTRIVLAFIAMSIVVGAACSQTAMVGQTPPPIETTSSTAEIALAEHLASIGAVKYGAWWCPHCHAQQTLFGQEAFDKISYVECDPQGANARTQLCQSKGVQSFPTWEIGGQMLAGVQSLETLATISSYEGPANFKNQSASPAQ